MIQTHNLIKGMGIVWYTQIFVGLVILARNTTRNSRYDIGPQTSACNAPDVKMQFNIGFVKSDVEYAY